MRSRLVDMRWLVACLVLPLAACGFHLQAPSELPAAMGQTLIQAQNPYSTFVRRLTILLEQNGVHVVDSLPATAILEIPLNEVSLEVLTIGDNARVREYRVRHQVTFRLVDDQGVVLVPEQSLERSRVISFDEQDILAATREEEFLRDELADTMSRIVMRRLGDAKA
jgi:LPS-assembly lipoprotein